MAPEPEPIFCWSEPRAGAGKAAMALAGFFSDAKKKSVVLTVH